MTITDAVGNQATQRAYFDLTGEEEGGREEPYEPREPGDEETSLSSSSGSANLGLIAGIAAVLVIVLLVAAAAGGGERKGRR